MNIAAPHDEGFEHIMVRKRYKETANTIVWRCDYCRDWAVAKINNVDAIAKATRRDDILELAPKMGCSKPQ